jgi:hypothetical protein
MANHTMEARLLAAQVAIDNSLNDAEVQTYLAQYGYDSARLNQGKTLLAAAQQLHQKQTVEYGEQFAATTALQSAWDRANAEYMRCVKVARVALKSDRGAHQKLDLDGKRKVSISGWIVQAKQFYTNALADAAVLAKLAEFGITQEKLQAGQQLVNTVETANAAQEKEKGEAQQATLERDAALESLDDWLSDFTAIARVALEEKPQLLETLGILKLSPGGRPGGKNPEPAPAES